MFFDSWHGLSRVLILAPCLYLGLILMLRVSGKRTLSKMNAFDLVVTIALGSILASTITTKSVAMAEGMLSLAVLIGLQFVIAWGSVRSRRLGRLVKSTPAMVFYEGAFLESAMRHERLTANEVIAAIRASGVGSIDRVRAVVLETSGDMSVIRATEASTDDRLFRDIRMPESLG